MDIQNLKSEDFKTISKDDIVLWGFVNQLADYSIIYQ